MAALPTLTAEERAEGLKKALESRREKAAALAEITNGSLKIEKALAGEDPRLAKVKVRRVLRAVKGVGDVRADRLMAEAGVAENRTVKGLGPNQRVKLTDLLAA